MEDQQSEVTKQQTEQIVKEQIVDQNPHGPEDIAAVFFQRHTPVFINAVNKLSFRQLKRVLINLTLGPLAPREYLPSKEIEKHAAYIGNELIFERVIMQLHVEMQRAQEAENKTLTSEENSNKMETSNNNSLKEGESSNG